MPLCYIKNARQIIIPATIKSTTQNPIETKGNSTLLAKYDANQIRYAQISNKGDYTYCILGHQADLNLEKLKALGPIRTLSKEEIFGY